MIRRRVAWCLLVAGLCAVPGVLAAQQHTARFRVLAVTDTSLTFDVGQADWVKAGREGISVDPRRRDVLIARFRVVRVSDHQALAVVVGQTEPLSTEHVALLTEPSRPFWKTRSFWFGLVGGLALGFGVGSSG